VQQGAKGHFAWVVDKDGTVEQRPVTVGDWYGQDWFINEGLNSGDQLVVDGGMRLSPGATAIVVQADGEATGKASAAAGSVKQNP
jgi:membrane fusion protein, multidrug efflux system